jgi:hypothetical protein
VALVVEDGTGRADAESYISVAYFDEYAANYGYDLTSKTEPQKEQALRRATIWFDAVYGVYFSGTPVSADQALYLPQTEMYDYRGVLAPSDEVLPAAERSVAEAAWREITTPHSLLPDVVANQVQKSVKVDVISIEYETHGAVGSIPTLSIVDGLMKPWVGMRRGRVLYGRADRG